MQQKLIILLLSGLLLLPLACKDNQQTSKTEQQTSQVQVIDAQQANQLTEINKELIILDVRTSGEYSEGHLNNAQNVDFSGHFAQKIKDLDKNKPYLVYCQRGGRSNKAATMMAQAGFKTIYDMKGGFSHWQTEGLPSKK